MSSRSQTLAVALFAIATLSGGARAQQAFPPTPPMGWNSWDSYGTTIDEPHFKQNVDWMQQHLAAFGWRYAVVDMEWFVTSPTAEGNSKQAQRVMDASGRYIPAPNRFPSSAGGKGFAPLAEYTHAKGLKFGIHILQGIPRDAVEHGLPIEGSSLHAQDAADTSGECAWNPDNYDLRRDAAGQAYYDSIARLYASWGVDLIKVDCVGAPRLKAEEIAMLRRALDKTGRSIALSLSPGEPPIEQVEVMQANAQQWRISNDIWDMWHSDVAYPQGLGDQFARAAYWSRTRQPGHWPDADMLPLGHLGPAPGWGKPRDTRLTHTEQRTMLTLWSIFRSPLMMGGDLPSTDAWTLGLLTNPEVIEVDQHSSNNRAVLQTPDFAAWTATAADGRSIYLALFNLQDTPRQRHLTFSDLSVGEGSYAVRDLWAREDRGEWKDVQVQLEPHGAMLLRLTPVERAR